MKTVNTRLVNDVLNAVRSIVVLPDQLRPPVWVDGATGPDPKNLIVLKNGILDITTRELLAPNRSYFTTTALSFDYDPDALSPVQWEEFLHSLWGGVTPDCDDEGSVESLQEWFGYLLSTDTSLQKMLFLIGPTRSGKGTIIRIIKELVGETNLAGPTLNSLTSQFGLSPLYGKSVAVINDARLHGRPDTAVIVERLLSITGEDTQTVDRKHLPMIDTKLGTRIIMVSNELPKLSDASGALVNRMIVLRFIRSFLGREDTNLTEKLTAELPGILLWALDGLDRLRKRGRFLQPPSSAELISDLAELSSPITAFLRDRVIVDHTSMTLVKDAFAEWKSWCTDHGRDHSGTEQSFGRELRAAIPSLKSTQPRVNGARYRAYLGFRLRTAFDDEPEATTGTHTPHGRSDAVTTSDLIEF